MAENISHIEKLEEFDDIMKGNKLVVVDFFSDWCGPCCSIAPFFVKLSKEFPEAKFIKINVDKGKDISEKVKVNRLPTFLFYKEGNEIGRMEGANEKQLNKEIYSLVGKCREKEQGIISNLQEYESSISSKKYVTIFFMAENYEISIEKKIIGLLKELRNKEQYKNIEFLIVDPNETEESEEINKKSDIKKLPTFIFFKDSKEDSRFEGISKRKLIRNLEKLVGLPFSDKNEYPNTIEKYNNFIDENKLVCSVFLSEWKENFEKINRYFDKLSEEKEWRNIKFIKIYLEESSDIFIRENPQNIPGYMFYKDGKIKTMYCGEDESIITKKLCLLTGKPFHKKDGCINNIIEFEEFIKKNKLIAVFFFKDWCIFCNRISLKFEEHMKNPEYSEVKFIKVDVEENEDIFKKYEIEKIPGFAFFKEGRLLNKFYGPDPKRIEKSLWKVIGKPLPKVEGQIDTIEEYESIIKNNKLVVFAFFSEYNHDCKYIIIPFTNYQKFYKEIKFFKIDVDESKDICIKYNFTKAPLFIYYEDGKEIKRSEVAHLDQIINDVEELLPSEGESYLSKFHKHPLYPKKGNYFSCNHCNNAYFKKDIKKYYCQICKFYYCGNCKDNEEKNEFINEKELVKSE